MYDTSTAKLVEAVLQGKNCSVFCYGATGAGKTYTMLGSIHKPGVMVLTSSRSWNSNVTTRHWFCVKMQNRTNSDASSLQFGEMQNTLHWASGARKIRIKHVSVNEELEFAGSKNEQTLFLLEIQKENRELKLEIACLQQERAAPDPSASPSNMQSVIRSSLDKGADIIQRTISELRKALLFLESGVNVNANRSESSMASLKAFVTLRRVWNCLNLLICFLCSNLNMNPYDVT